MKNCLIALSSALALTACSSSNSNGTSGTGTGSTGSGTTTSASTSGTTTSSSGTTGASGGPTFEPAGVAPCTTSGCITITFTEVDVHPAAKAALGAIGFPVPNIASGAYGLTMQGVGLSPTFTAQLNSFGTYQITAGGGPYVYSISSTQSTKDATIGIIGGIGLVNSDGGSPMIGDGGFIPQPTCAQWATLVQGAGAVLDAGGTTATVGDYLVDAGFTDYIVSTGLAVEQPPVSSVASATAYGNPLSYMVLLNCAGSQTKTTRDLDQGVALVYSVDATGVPVEGVSYSLVGTGNAPSPTYYSNEYQDTTTASTDSTGVATFLNVETSATGAGSVNATDSAGDTFVGGADGEIATNTNTVFNVVMQKQ